MLTVNTHTFSGRLARDPELNVITSKSSGEGSTVVVLNLAATHPHDRRKPYADRRVQYSKVRLYGKTAEAANKNLRTGDEVLVVNATRVQDAWVDQETKRQVRLEYFEPPPMGLQYDRVRSMGMGSPFPERS